jgi:hypothetical protein
MEDGQLKLTDFTEESGGSGEPLVERESRSDESKQSTLGEG